MSTKPLPKGIRQNNPLNIVHVEKNKWQGLADPPAIGRFCVFVTMAHGIRAAALNLIAYQDRYNFKTIRDFVGRWAPASENNTVAYVLSVSKRTGFAADKALDLHNWEDLRPLVEAMAYHENGGNFLSDAALDKGLSMAGVEPPMKPLAATRTMKGAQGAAIGGAAISTVVAVADQVTPYIGVVTTIAQYAPWALAVALAGGIAYMAWARWDDRKKGLR